MKLLGYLPAKKHVLMRNEFAISLVTYRIVRIKCVSNNKREFVVEEFLDAKDHTHRHCILELHEIAPIDLTEIDIVNAWNDINGDQSRSITEIGTENSNWLDLLEICAFTINNRNKRLSK